MTQPSLEDLFRRAAEEEGGYPVSAGARLIHAQKAIEAGRGLYVDLSGVPEERRAALASDIKNLVQRATQSAKEPASGPDAPGKPG